MQVVYSGGSTTPSPSPRLQRKNMQGYGRPVLPGYLMGPPPTNPHSRSKEKVNEGDKSLRDSIPAMKKPLAVTCLIFNVILPGVGTFVAGLSVLCCSRVRPKNSSKSSVIRVNSYVAFLQFITTFLFLLGWIWSIMWGIAFLTISEYYKNPDADPELKEHHHHQHHHHHHHHHHHQHVNDHQHHLTKIPSIPENSPDSPDPDSDSSPPHNNGTLQVQNFNHARELYVAPAPSSNQAQPMITLQQPPVHHSELSHKKGPIMNARTRHQKIIQRQMSDNQLSPFTLTHEHLEAIVIHDAPFQAPRPQAQRTEPVESSTSAATTTATAATAAAGATLTPSAPESNGVAVST